MINKLLANLPFNPSMIEEVGFYAARLRQESSIRRIGLVFIVLSMFVQIFAAAVPPEKSLAYSGNNVIATAPINSISELQKKCLAHPEVKGLYARFGLDCNRIDTYSFDDDVNFNYDEQGSDKEHPPTRTVGRLEFEKINDFDLGPYPSDPKRIEFHSRNAAAWDGSEKAYFFGKRKGTDGKYYFVWVIKNCGNIAYRHADTPPPKPPAPTPPPSEPPAPVVTSTPVTIPPAATPPATTPPPVTPPPVTPPPVTPATCKDTASCLPPDQKKQAENITQGLAPSQTLTSKARAGDVIEYTLTTTNLNDEALIKYSIEDNLTDTLDYATVDQAFLAKQGGSLSSDKKTVLWANQTIPAKGETKKVFRVVMKNPLPLTNKPNATAPEFDCKIENTYGSLTSIPVDCAVLKSIEELPNTGPGTSLAIAFTVTVASTYFFARSRLLAKELTLVKKEYTSSGV